MLHFSATIFKVSIKKKNCLVSFPPFCFLHAAPPSHPSLHPPSPSPLPSLSVNENVLTRKKDLLGPAQFIRKAEVCRKKKEKKKEAAAEEEDVGPFKEVLFWWL